jgi:DNA-binding NarL/FixJ family response regulator
MTTVHILSSPAVVRAGLESMILGSGTLTLASDESTADVLLAAPAHPSEDWIASLSGYAQPVVVLADIPDPAWLAAALRSNIRAVLSTESSPEEIVAAVASAAAGLVTLQPPALDMLSQAPRSTAEALEDPLTPRELEVLAMLAEGLSNKIVAYRLGISEHTVKFHVTSILTKLGAGSRTDAVMQGIRRGLIMM